MKHEAPPFRMVVEKGRLVPATPFDAERLDSYRNGTAIKVRLVEEKDRVLVRKWWAVLNRAVKECKTPWQTSAEASEAIKLALGIVNLSKTVGGQFMAYPKSLTELTDPELQDAVDQMLAILFRITGVDPDDWRKQIAHVGEDESGSSPSPTDEPEDSVSVHPSPDSLSDPEETPVEAGAEGQEQSEPAPASEEFSDDDWKWIRQAARRLWISTGKGEQELVEATSKALVIEMPETIGKAARDKATSIKKLCKQVCYGEMEIGDARKLVATHIGASEDELRGWEPQA